jgi:hypothetical protein
MVRSWTENGAKGVVKVDLRSIDLPGGVYIVQLRQREAIVFKVVHVVQKDAP